MDLEKYTLVELRQMAKEKGAKNISVKSFNPLKGWLYQLIFGNHVKNILISIKSIIKSNNL